MAESEKVETVEAKCICGDKATMAARRAVTSGAARPTPAHRRTIACVLRAAYLPSSVWRLACTIAIGRVSACCLQTAMKLPTVAPLSS